ncbi:hypothetical protein N7495_004110 [Penicillium taxi]|uniref:uncharacterized protein n=1 Tax=Penicillium taxi TaxID=168475 RepID=UPI002544DB80|nr:uncharacterized protein N7495_004110 [Penicillium taxi]KAJ5899366.1 hypothetical protein N7495_004110 [Penicillium taxi]
MFAHHLGVMREAWITLRRDQNPNDFHIQPESSRLLDDDPYQAGYGYGALNHAQQQNQPDPEYVRREREALDAICQRTSDSVIDIWSLQPQPHLQPQATLQKSPKTDQTQQPVTVSEGQTSRPTSDGAVPKHWGEVVVNPKRSRPDMKARTPAQDVFGVLKVN